MSEVVECVILTETVISFVEAARKLPSHRQDRPVTVSCIFRWVQKGVKTPNGLVRLEAVKLGGHWLTSVEALQRFAAAQTPDFANHNTQLPRTSSARQRASEKAAEQLRNLGI